MDDRRVRDDHRAALHREFGANIEHLCDAQKITRQELADKIRRPRQFFTRLRAGRDASVRLDTVEDLCVALKVPPQDVLAPLLTRIAKNQGSIPQPLLALRSDPAMTRWREASYRLSMATMDLSAADLEFFADLLEGRARAATATPEGSPGRLTHS